MKLFEMEGFLRGKCLPGDMMVNETNAEYLVRKISCFQAQVKQLAAENAALKNWAENRAKSDDALEQERYSTLKIDYRQRLLSNIQTPATDAYADSLRAEGVEMAIEAAKPLIASEFQYSYFDACVSAAYKFPESDLVGKVGMIKWMQGFAAQLRSKSEVRHD